MSKKHFKIGDWVTFIDTINDYEDTKKFIEKITEIDDSSFQSINQIFFVDFDKVKLWFPKKNDFVFIKTNILTLSDYEYTILIKVKDIDKENNEVLLDDGSIVNISHLEPFNGHKPYGQ